MSTRSKYAKEFDKVHLISFVDVHGHHDWILRFWHAMTRRWTSFWPEYVWKLELEFFSHEWPHIIILRIISPPVIVIVWILYLKHRWTFTQESHSIALILIYGKLEGFNFIFLNKEEYEMEVNIKCSYSNFYEWCIASKKLEITRSRRARARNVSLMVVVWFSWRRDQWFILRILRHYSGCRHQ